MIQRSDKLRNWGWFRCLGKGGEIPTSFWRASKCLLSDPAESELMPSFGGYWLSGLISTLADQNEFQIGLAGGEVTLNCADIPDSKLTRNTIVRWMYYNTRLCQRDETGFWKSKASNSLPLLPSHSWETSSLLTKPIFPKAPAFNADKFDIKAPHKQLQVRNLKLSDAGIYTCEYGPHKVHTSLHIFQCEWVKWVSGGLLVIRRGGDHKGWGDISAGILYPGGFLLSQAITVHFSSISRAQCFHVLFALTLVFLSRR